MTHGSLREHIHMFHKGKAGKSILAGIRAARTWQMSKDMLNGCTLQTEYNHSSARFVGLVLNQKQN
ncbi:hypothetical protein N7540_001582 [Penicillium herquei]|nr:hypothetical protein N7540_001582 [Penicillium herquei]